jgi:hypothetical protein
VIKKMAGRNKAIQENFMKMTTVE